MRTKPSLAPLLNCVVARRPLLAGDAVELAGRRHLERALKPAVRIRVGGRGEPVLGQREPISAGALARFAPEHPEEIVVGVVLQHQHDDVLDLGDRVGADREARRWEASREGACASGPARGAPRAASREAVSGRRRGRHHGRRRLTSRPASVPAATAAAPSTRKVRRVSPAWCPVDGSSSGNGAPASAAKLASGGVPGRLFL